MEAYLKKSQLFSEETTPSQLTVQKIYPQDTCTQMLRPGLISPKHRYLPVQSISFCRQQGELDFMDS